MADYCKIGSFFRRKTCWGCDSSSGGAVFPSLGVFPTTYVHRPRQNVLKAFPPCFLHPCFKHLIQTYLTSLLLHLADWSTLRLFQPVTAGGTTPEIRPGRWPVAAEKKRRGMDGAHRQESRYRPGTLFVS